MARHRGNLIRFVQDQLVDDKLDCKFDTLGKRPDITAISWQHRNYAGRHTRLETAYGMLEVCRTLGGHTLMRDGAPLVHARSPREAIFASQRAAKAAGLVHLTDGFGDAPPYEDGLWWHIRRPTAEPPVPQAPGDFAADPSLSDDHEWGCQRLDRLLKESDACAADENLVLDVEAVGQSWQLSRPTWTKRAHGCFELNTPYGILVVRRLIGWTVERNGVPLCWSLGGKKVIIDKLEHAKTAAVACARYYNGNGISGVRWGNSAYDQAVESDTFDQFAAEEVGVSN